MQLTPSISGIPLCSVFENVLYATAIASGNCSMELLSDAILTTSDEAKIISPNTTCSPESSDKGITFCIDVVPLRPGEAWIKSEYLVPHQSISGVQNNSETPCTENEVQKVSSLGENDHREGPPRKKKDRGMNKNRPRQLKPTGKDKICSRFVENETCPFGEKCNYSHDLESFIAKRLPDIGETCVNFKLFGKCRYGVTCRFGKEHLTEDLKNIDKRDSFSQLYTDRVKNSLTSELQYLLRKKKFEYPRSGEYLKKMKVLLSQKKSLEEVGECERIGLVTDEDIIKPRLPEKKTVDFSDKLYLAPLTTVGNLPFRRICKGFGADITCGEMAMCTSLLQGTQSEWALVKRHPCEDIFGVQLCGSFPDSMSQCSELLQSRAEIDFIDINVGCPIDLVFNKGAGSALMERVNRFEQIVRGMKYVLDIPVTVKMRTGIHDKNWNAHKLIPKLKDWEVSLISLHGRSREQRYTKSADWSYINQCAEIASPVPLFGSGDILSFEDVIRHKEETGISGVLIARGALIKPWIFTEIKEQRHWDISSSERLDILKKYANYGLEHCGTDFEGVEKTRRFLLEWLSFLYRYIPVGLLERIPQRINERPPPYYGRDDLETLMSSNKCEDWIKISEMVLGPVPPDFKFLPKHKANSYS